MKPYVLGPPLYSLAPGPLAPSNVIGAEVGAMAFRLSAKRVFATWSQVGNYTLEQWSSELEKQDYGCPFKYVVGRERHQDGGVHFHAILEFEKKRNFRSANCLDLFGIHGKYESVRDIQSCYRYCTKDGQTVTNDQAWANSHSSGTKRRLGELTTVTSAEEALEIFRTQAPRDYFLYYDKIKHNCEQIFKKQKQDYTSTFTLQDFPNAHDDILHWYANEVMGPHPKVRFAPLCVLRTREGSR